MHDKELEKLQRKATKLIKKCDDECYEFSDLEISIITKITKADSMKDINWLAEQQFVRLCERLL